MAGAPAAFLMFRALLSRDGERQVLPFLAVADANGAPFKLQPQDARDIARAARSGSLRWLGDVRLPSGRYRLVPIDRQGRRVAAPPIEFVITKPIDTVSATADRNDDEQIRDHIAARLAERVIMHPRARDPDVQDAAHLLVRHVNQNSDRATILKAAPGAERDAAIERMVDDFAGLFLEVADRGRIFNDPPAALTGESVRAVAREPMRCSLGAIRDACASLRYDDAIARIFARACLNMATPADELGPLLAGLARAYLIHGLFVVVSGDRAAVALDSVRARGIPTDRADATARALALFLAWRYRAADGTDDIRARLVPLARTVARAQLDAEAAGLIYALAVELDDPGFHAVVTAQQLGAHDLNTAAVMQFAPSIDDIVRDLDTPGRFDTRVMPLWPPDLAELVQQPPPTTPEALLDATRRYAEAQLWDHATATAAIAQARELEPCADRCHALIAEHAALAGHVTLAAAELARVRDGLHVPSALQLAFALAQGEIPYDEAMRELIANVVDRPVQIERFARALLTAAPPLGLIVARACLPTTGDAESLLAVIEHTRDVLGLPPFDAAWTQHAHARESIDLRTSIGTTVAALVAEREAARAERVAAERRAAAEHADAERARGDYRAEREHVATVEATLRERNAEKAELRRQLAEVGRERDELRDQLAERDRAATAPGGELNDDEHDGDDGDPVAASVRRPAAFELNRDTRAALRDVPQHVAAEMLRTLGQLAAGDAAAWRRVKQAKGTETPIFHARIGLHHRLIFRTDEDGLRTVALVTRESLLGALKRVRDARREPAR